MPLMPTEARKPFVMPDWMEPYRDMIEMDLGGNTVENLLDDTTTNGFNNAIRSALICMAEAKVRLLYRLHREGRLVPATDESQKPTEEAT